MSDGLVECKELWDGGGDWKRDIGGIVGWSEEWNEKRVTFVICECCFRCEIESWFISNRTQWSKCQIKE